VCNPFLVSYAPLDMRLVSLLFMSFVTFFFAHFFSFSVLVLRNGRYGHS
jgi:hypothetical protein